MKKLFVFGLVSSLLFMFTACNKDNTTPDAPNVTAPSGTVAVQVSDTTDITFSVDVPGGYASSSVTASGGAATVAGEPANGAKSGSVMVQFVAEANAGTGLVTLTVTDKNSKFNDQTAAISISDAPVKPTKDIYASGNGTGTVTWSADTTYILRGFIFVNDGQTLTIEPGTVIKGQQGQGAGASALIVARGGKLMAEGTEQAPIIMTGLADDLNGSVPDDANQLWGGLIILGKATTSNVAEGGVKSIEGIPESEERGKYGGTDDNDNSGVITYVSVRHGGSVIGADNEINGISLGAVGSKTVLDHIEVFSNFDDGIEFFGGAAKVTNVAIVYPGDDGLDQDEGFHGSVQNAIVWETGQTRESGDPRGCELDGGVGANEPEKPFATPTMSNITVYFDGPEVKPFTPSDNQTFYMRDGWGGQFYNSIFYGFEGPIDMERRTDKINPEDNKPASCYDQWLPVADGGYGNLKIENNIMYTGGATTNDSLGFAKLFVLSDETDATKEASVEAYLMAHNVIVDPAFGTGMNKFTPTAAEAKQNLFTSLPASKGMTTPTYKGAVDPDGTPFFANWSRLSEVLSSK